jgi:hypothetical protein
MPLQGGSWSCSYRAWVRLGELTGTAVSAQVLNVLKSVRGKNADDAKLNETAIWCLCTLCKCLENAKLAVQVGGIKPVSSQAHREVLALIHG